DLEEKAEENRQLGERLAGLESKLAEAQARLSPLLRVAVCMGSAEDPKRDLAWDRRFQQLERDGGIKIEAEYFHRGKLPAKGFDVWLLDEKTVAGHKEHKHRFADDARRNGAEPLNARDTTDIALAKPRLRRV